MKPVLIVIVWLIVIAPSDAANDWLSWRKVGDATLTWGPFPIYTSQLRTPQGRYVGMKEDQALIITYHRHIDRNELVDATRDQWKAQGILVRERQSELWLRMMDSLLPDVMPGMQLAFVQKDKRGQFWYRMSVNKGYFFPLGTPQPEAFSENFLAIWLSPRTQYPELRQQLTGGQK